MKPDDPAFPADFSYECEVCHSAVMATTPHAGVTVRAYFAGKAMQGMAASAQWSENFQIANPMYLSAVAKIAIAAADALIAELNKEKS